MGGLPLGMPPLPEDPVLSKAAPEECLFYTMAAGAAEPDAKSKSQTEQLMAEPEVVRLAAEIQKALIAAVKRDAARKSPQDQALADDAIYLAKTLLARPVAVYLADLKIVPGKAPEVRAGAILNAGDDAEKIKALIERYQKQAFSTSSEVTLGGRTFQQFVLPGGPAVTWGLAGKHLLVAVGAEEMQALMERVKGAPPAWLAKIRKEMPIDRLSTVARVDVKAIIEKFGPLAGPQFASVMETTGFGAITQLAAISGLDQEGCVNRLQIAIDGKPRGLLALVDQKPLVSKDLAVIPADATFAAAASFDAAKAMEIVLAVVEKLSPRDAKHFREGVTWIEQETSLSVATDLLKPLGTSWRVFDSPSGGGMFTGVTAVLSVRDPQQFGGAMDEVLKVAEAAMERPDNRGPKIERIAVGKREILVFNPRDRDALIAPSWCLADDQLVIGLYPQAVKAYLARDGQFRSLEKVPAAAGTIEGGETIKCVYMDTQRVFDLVYPMLPVAAQAIATGLQRENIDLPAGLLPSASAIRPHLMPSVTSVKRTKAGLEVISRQTFPNSGALSSAPLAAGLVLPAITSARAAARKAQSMNNLKQIALAMLSYENAFRSLPPAYTTDKEGKPLVSWRVAILPFLEQRVGVMKDEPWDSEHNKQFLEKMPPIFRSPNSNAPPGFTNYLVIRGDKTVFPGAKPVNMAMITDGMSRTIMVVEVSDEKAVPWTKPDDFEPDAQDPRKGLVGLQSGGFLAAFCDGSVHFIRSSIPPDTLRNLFDRNDHNPVDLGQYEGGVANMPPQKGPQPDRPFKDFDRAKDSRPIKGVDQERPRAEPAIKFDDRAPNALGREEKKMEERKIDKPRFEKAKE